MMISIKDSTVTFESVYNSAFAPKDNSLKEANLLLLPYHNIRPNVEYCFSEYSEEFLRLLRIQKREDVIPDIAITDEDFQTIEFHSLLLDMGIIIVSYVVLPFTVNILASFVYDKIKAKHEKKENVTVRVEIITQDSKGNSKAIKYEGLASNFEIVKEAVQSVLKNDNRGN